jgi:hypothetical protein
VGSKSKHDKNLLACYILVLKALVKDREKLKLTDKQKSQIESLILKLERG